MGYRVIEPTKMLDAGDMSQATLTTAIALNLKHLSAGALYLTWTGVPVGSFSVQGSPDGSAGSFQDMGISIPDAAGAPGGAVVDLQRTGVNFVQVVYTKGSGTGALTIVGTGKGE